MGEKIFPFADVDGPISVDDFGIAFGSALIVLEVGDKLAELSLGIEDRSIEDRGVGILELIGDVLGDGIGMVFDGFFGMVVVFRNLSAAFLTHNTGIQV